MKRTIILLLSILVITSCGVHNKISYSKVKPSINVYEEDVSQYESPSTRTSSATSDLKNNDLQFDDSPNDEITNATNEENNKPVDCDNMLLRNGEEISVKIIEIGTTEIKYKKCDNLEGPTISILKKNVFMITYPNGSKDVFKEEVATSNQASNSNVQPTQQRTNGFAIASFVLGITGFGSILAVLFGSIALNQMRDNPGVYAGRGLAIAGQILGTLSILIGLILIVAVL